ARIWTPRPRSRSVSWPCSWPAATIDLAVRCGLVTGCSVRYRMLLETITSPADLRTLTEGELVTLAGEIREFIVQAVAVNGGHLGSNLGVVEVTLAIHRVFDSPRDIVLWDTGHQAYVHKIVTGRREDLARLKQAGGLSGCPNRAQSGHDW